jgi:hypothetical protein
MDKRGLRNNNPGNIRRSNERYQGEVRPSLDPAFKQFESMAYGYRALMRVLKTYYHKHGLHTIREMINRWAPKSENPTGNYISAVVRDTGKKADEWLTWDKSTVMSLAAAMSNVECGEKPNMAEVERGWILLEGNEDE